MTDALMRSALAAGAGCVIGWGANSLTLTGRVDAIERSLQRIEQMLYQPKIIAPPGSLTK